MFCKEIYRQRTTIELITKLNLKNFSSAELLLTNFLNTLSSALKMTPFMGPFIQDTHLGPSAFMGWMESGVQVHCWHEYNFVSIDIYSCKPYTVSDALGVVEHYFDLVEVEVL